LAILVDVRQDPPYFEGQDAQLIYIAKRMSDATEVEELLTREGIDYGVEADTYTGGFLFRTQRVGAFFYVLPQIADDTRQLLSRNGWKPAQNV
jgi:hypothetical protein